MWKSDEIIKGRIREFAHYLDELKIEYRAIEYIDYHHFNVLFDPAHEKHIREAVGIHDLKVDLATRDSYPLNTAYTLWFRD